MAYFWTTCASLKYSISLAYFWKTCATCATHCRSTGCVSSLLSWPVGGDVRRITRGLAKTSSRIVSASVAIIATTLTICRYVLFCRSRVCRFLWFLKTAITRVCVWILMLFYIEQRMDIVCSKHVCEALRVSWWVVKLWRRLKCQPLLLGRPDQTLRACSFWWRFAGFREWSFDVCGLRRIVDLAGFLAHAVWKEHRYAVYRGG